MPISDKELDNTPTIFGHPTGLFQLFFAEMWERFSYYGMRALLVFYMLKGFLAFGDNEAYAVYGAYTSLVYATPFIGGILADRLLGERRAVVLGGTLMALGHLLMTVQHKLAFFAALALLIAGNGFFKPNISAIVGSLYPKSSTKKDSGFTLFYMGINLGAAMAPLLCGYIGENYGWHYGFGLATTGMLLGVAIFVLPSGLTRFLILIGSLLTAGAMVFLQKGALLLAVNGIVALALIIAAFVAFTAIGRGPLPRTAGQPSDPALLQRKIAGFLRADWAVYIGILLSIALFTLLVQNHYVAGWTLSIFGVIAMVLLINAAFRSPVVERHRLFVIFILMFFSMMFWAFFEQAGSSVNNFTDRNVDRVQEKRLITSSEVGKTIQIELTQEQIGYPFEGKPLTLDQLDRCRKESKDGCNVSYPLTAEHVGMGVGGTEVPASVFQSVNPSLIMFLGLILSAMWAWLARRRLEPSTPLKFALGLLQLGLGFGAFWYGTLIADARGMVAVGWLLAGYLLHTTGELCLSPVGLSMITKLAPERIVSTVMGAWFLATAFSNYLAGALAKLTGVAKGEGLAAAMPLPAETLKIYGDVFAQIALASLISSALLFFLVPLLRRWMHEES